MRLRARRPQAELTQERLAAQPGVALSTLRKIENGRVIGPGFFTVIALTQALGISIVEVSPTESRLTLRPDKSPLKPAAMSSMRRYHCGQVTLH